MPTYRDSLPEQDPLGSCLLCPLALRLQGPTHWRAAADLGRGSCGANNPKLEAGSPDDAYVPSGGTMHRAAASGATLAATPQKEE